MKLITNIFLTSCILLLFTGCMQKDSNVEPTGNRTLELTKLSTKGITDQQPADQAKEFLSHYEEVSGVRAVNHKGQLLVAVEINHHDRFFLDNLERELRKDVKKNFQEMKVTLSTDQKIFIELDQLETDMTNKDISQKEIKKRMNDLKKLSKEQT